MKNKPFNKKLVLNKKTIAHLNIIQLSNVKGGGLSEPDTCNTDCCTTDYCSEPEFCGGDTIRTCTADQDTVICCCEH